MRQARSEDTPRILVVLVTMPAEARVREFDLDLSKLDRFIRWLIASPAGIVLVSGDPICAVLMGVVQEMWFGRDKEAFNLPLYVLPENRGGPHAVRLVAAYKERAAALGAKDIQLCITSGIAPEKTNGLVQRLGFTPIGGYFAAGA